MRFTLVSHYFSWGVPLPPEKRNKKDLDQTGVNFVVLSQVRKTFYLKLASGVLQRVPISCCKTHVWGDHRIHLPKRYQSKITEPAHMVWPPIKAGSKMNLTGNTKEPIMSMALPQSPIIRQPAKKAKRVTLSVFFTWGHLICPQVEHDLLFIILLWRPYYSLLWTSEP